VNRQGWRASLSRVGITSAALITLALSHVACYRPYPPNKPSGLPADAVWAGGLDGGGWVLCSASSAEYNDCTIYDEEGRTQGPARYVLKGSGAAAKTDQLKYTYVTGKAIGLKGGLELQRVGQTK
jgi:hypothetical protein